jgi:hypothetical protein
MVGLPGHASDELARGHFGADVDLGAYNNEVDARVKERLEQASHSSKASLSYSTCLMN